MNHANMNVNSTVENVTRIKIRIKVNVHKSVKIKKKILCARKIIFRILLHVVVKMVNI